MSVSRRFAVLIVVGIPLLLLLLPTGLSVAVFLLYNITLFGLLLIDILLTPSAKGFQVKRSDDYKLSHYALNQISFRIYNPHPYLLQIEAKDSPSHRHFVISERDLIHKVAPGEEKIFSYNVTPSKRGAFTFTQIYVKLTGLLGFVVKYHMYSYPMEFKVYPNLKDLQRFRIMMQKNHLLPQGDKTIRMFGTGTEFESLRTYVEGDDYRKINWPVSARERRLIVNDYQLEKNQPVFLLIDGGRPMSYNVKGYKKLDYAINAALVLSDIVNQKGDQSGLLVFDKAVKSVIMPGKGANHRNNLMETLYHIQETRDTSNYGEAFRTLCRRQKRRSLVFIFTDFETLEEAQALYAHIEHLKRRHFPIVIFMKNDELISLTSSEDPYIQEVATDFLNERKQLFRRLNAMSVPNVETAAETFSISAVNKYLALRR